MTNLFFIIWKNKVIQDEFMWHGLFIIWLICLISSMVIVSGELSTSINKGIMH